MRNYLCVPYSIYDQIGTNRIEKLSEEFNNQLKKYYGTIQTEVVRKNKAKSIEV